MQNQTLALFSSISAKADISWIDDKLNTLSFHDTMRVCPHGHGDAKEEDQGSGNYDVVDDEEEDESSGDEADHSDQKRKAVAVMDDLDPYDQHLQMKKARHGGVVRIDEPNSANP
ncbi:hypothetical protein ACE6H2_007899 [Prunus campanulata]